jgi:hypothetical protein
MTRAEQETILRWAADEDVVSIVTAHPPTKRKLERAGYKPHRTSTERGVEVGWFYRVPISELRWQAGARKKRTLSPAQLQALRGGRA